MKMAMKAMTAKTVSLRRSSRTDPASPPGSVRWGLRWTSRQLEAFEAQTVRGQTGGRTCLKACPQASQPPDHDGRDVGNCAHHCGDHGLIENGHGCTPLPSDGSARAVVQSAIRLCVD